MPTIHFNEPYHYDNIQSLTVARAEAREALLGHLSENQTCCLTADDSSASARLYLHWDGLGNPGSPEPLYWQAYVPADTTPGDDSTRYSTHCEEDLSTLVNYFLSLGDSDPKEAPPEELSGERDLLKLMRIRKMDPQTLRSDFGFSEEILRRRMEPILQAGFPLSEALQSTFKAPDSSVETDKAVSALLARNRKVEAIHLLRKEMGLSLVDAKLRVERWES